MAHPTDQSDTRITLTLGTLRGALHEAADDFKYDSPQELLRAALRAWLEERGRLGKGDSGG